MTSIIILLILIKEFLAALLRGNSLKFHIIKPKLDEQFAINDIVVSIKNKIDIEQRALEKMAIIKQALMQDLLTGKKEVTPDPEDFDGKQ